MIARTCYTYMLELSVVSLLCWKFSACCLRVKFSSQNSYTRIFPCAIHLWGSQKLSRPSGRMRNPSCTPKYVILPNNIPRHYVQNSNVTHPYILYCCCTTSFSLVSPTPCRNKELKQTFINPVQQRNIYLSFIILGNIIHHRISFKDRSEVENNIAVDIVNTRRRHTFRGRELVYSGRERAGVSLARSIRGKFQQLDTVTPNFTS